MGDTKIRHPPRTSSSPISSVVQKTTPAYKFIIIYTPLLTDLFLTQSNKWQFFRVQMELIRGGNLDYWPPWEKNSILSQPLKKMYYWYVLVLLPCTVSNSIHLWPRCWPRMLKLTCHQLVNFKHLQSASTPNIQRYLVMTQWITLYSISVDFRTIMVAKLNNM